LAGAGSGRGVCFRGEDKKKGHERGKEEKAKRNSLTSVQPGAVRATSAAAEKKGQKKIRRAPWLLVPPLPARGGCSQLYAKNGGGEGGGRKRKNRGGRCRRGTNSENQPYRGELPISFQDAKSGIQGHRAEFFCPLSRNVVWPFSYSGKREDIKRRLLVEKKQKPRLPGGKGPFSFVWPMA